jgi:hypothetical protein
MVLPTIWEDNITQEQDEIFVLTPIWQKLPKALVDVIMKEYLFCLEDLEKACAKDDVNTIQFICANCKLDRNRCLILASMNGYFHIVKYMIKFGATDKLRAFMTASLFGHQDIKQYLKKFID